MAFLHKCVLESTQFRPISQRTLGGCGFIIEHRTAHGANNENAKPLTPCPNHLRGELLSHKRNLVNGANGCVRTFIPEAWICHKPFPGWIEKSIPFS